MVGPVGVTGAETDDCHVLDHELRMLMAGRQKYYKSEDELKAMKKPMYVWSGFWTSLARASRAEQS